MKLLHDSGMITAVRRRPRGRRGLKHGANGRANIHGRRRPRGRGGLKRRFGSAESWLRRCVWQLHLAHFGSLIWPTPGWLGLKQRFGLVKTLASSRRPRGRRGLKRQLKFSFSALRVSPPSPRLQISIQQLKYRYLWTVRIRTRVLFSIHN